MILGELRLQMIETVVRWFRTTDEPWTKKISAHKINVELNVLLVIFQTA